jgi:hypothetical protein
MGYQLPNFPSLDRGDGFNIVIEKLPGGETMGQVLSQPKWLLLTAFFALLVAAQAIHWLITPTSTSASYARWWAVVAQAVIGIAVAVWFFCTARRFSREK